MKNFVFYLFSLLALLATKSLSQKRSAIIEYKLSNEKAKTFNKKVNKDLYESFVLGDKKQLPYNLQERFKRLGVIHIMTPSGLHYGVTLFFLLLMFRKFEVNKHMTYLIQIYLGVICYSYLSGLYAFRRYALLFSTRLFNKVFLNKYFSNVQIVLIVFLFDFFLGTKKFSPLSYALSFFFIGIFSLQNSKSKLSLYYHLFVGQCLIAYLFDNPISLLNLIVSPIFTAIFSFLYPLLSLNLIFLSFVNYSEIIIESLMIFFDFLYKLSDATGFFNLSLWHLFLLISLNKRNFLLILTTYFLMS